ncbi:hypothetical protein, partial [Candidatus Methylacidithermus pantelleriae]|uniref:hypothetical protein n=1 Tax=Candidatus Methylacidithermus pantelleriae TaxID=2744239 RepID=UPI00157CD826
IRGAAELKDSSRFNGLLYLGLYLPIYKRLANASHALEDIVPSYLVPQGDYCSQAHEEALNRFPKL